jgi:hypothetical protein
MPNPGACVRQALVEASQLGYFTTGIETEPEPEMIPNP